MRSSPVVSDIPLRLLRTLLASVGAAFAFSSSLSAEQVLFSVGNASAAEDKLYLANDDGSGATVLTSSSSYLTVPGRMAVDRVNRRVYVCDQTSGGGGLFRFNADGSGKTTLFTNTVSGSQVLGVAVDGVNGNVYFVVGNASAAEDKLYRCDLNGGSLTTIVSGSSFTNVPNSVAVDTVNQRVYVVDQTTSGGGVFRFDSNGSNKTTIYANSTSGSQVLGITVDSSRSFVYFITGNASAAEDKLFRCGLDGGGLTVLTSGTSLTNIPTQITVDPTANRLYVLDATSGAGGVFRFNSDGSNKTTIFANSTSGSQLLGLAMLPPQSTTVSSLNRSNVNPSNSATVNWTLTFGAATTGVTASNFSLSGTATSGASVGTPTTANSGLTWNVPVTTGSGDGSLQLNLANATGLSQSVSTSLPFGGESYTMDKTSPSISISSPSSSLTNGGPVSFTITYSDTNFSGSSLSPGNITVNSTGSASASSVGVTGSGLTRTVTLSGITGDGTLGISISSGTASDTAGNTASAVGPSTSFSVDNTAPAISIGAPSASVISTGSVSYTVTYSGENSVTLSGGDVTVNSTGTASASSVGVAGTGSTRTVTLSGITGDGTLGISVAAGTASDTAGNAAGAVGPSTSFTVDNTAPSITSGGTASGAYRNGGFSYIITASGGAVTFGASGLPSGLSFDSGSGAISGTPTQSGTFNATITATDAVGNTDSDPLTVTISPAGLTVTGLSASNKTYDGGTGATVTGTPSLSGVIGGDSVSLAGTASGTFADENVGAPKSVTVSGLSLTGADAGNYTLTQPTLSANIDAAGLTVTGITADDKPYDTGTGASLNLGSAQLVGVVGGDTVSLVTTSALGSFANADVADDKVVSVSGLSLDGADAGNYTLTQPSTTADITAVQLTVTADAKVRPYGYANPTLTATITGFVGGETSAVLSGSPELTTAANAASVPGPYTITSAIGSLSATNYTFTFADGTLTVRLLEIADWEEENFTPSELLDDGISGPAADPDLDGVTNFYEYAFGTDPNDFNSGPDGLAYVGSVLGGGTLDETGQPISRVEVTGSGTVTRVLFIRRLNSFTSDLTYAVQFSSNNTTWVTSSATPTVLASDGLVEVVAIPYQLITSGKKTRAFRVVPSLLE